MFDVRYCVVFLAMELGFSCALPVHAADDSDDQAIYVKECAADPAGRGLVDTDRMKFMLNCVHQKAISAKISKNANKPVEKMPN